jgi:hypothetical protein
MVNLRHLGAVSAKGTRLSAMADHSCWAAIGVTDFASVDKPTQDLVKWKSLAGAIDFALEQRGCRRRSRRRHSPIILSAEGRLNFQDPRHRRHGSSRRSSPCAAPKRNRRRRGVLEHANGKITLQGATSISHFSVSQNHTVANLTGSAVR